MEQRPSYNEIRRLKRVYVCVHNASTHGSNYRNVYSPKITF